MRTPWVNLLLLVLLLGQLVSGYAGLTNGFASRAWFLWVHGIGAYAIILLCVLKAGIIMDSLRRRRRWSLARTGFIVLIILLLVVTVLGLVWTFVGPIYVAGFSLVSLHIYLAVPLILLLAFHTWRMRFVLRLPETTERRNVLRWAAFALAGGVAWFSVGRAKAWLGLEGAERRFTGSYEQGSFGGRFPSVSWIADRPPPISRQSWLLVVDGAVEEPLRLSLDQLRAMALEEVVATLDCTGGWFTAQRWYGVPVSELLAMAGLLGSARSVTFEAVSGYKRRFSVEASKGFILALGLLGGGETIDRQPLSHEHGAPLRLVAPGRRGVEWVKWLGRLRVNETGPYWQSPLPLQ